MTGRDFVDCAEKFAKGSSEAELRSAVSRAYYGAFHEALWLLRFLRRFVSEDRAVKITAEVELVGLKARQSAIAEIIQNGQKSLILREKKERISRLMDHLQTQSIPTREKMIASYTAQRKAWEECPIQYGKVTIRPVKLLPPSDSGQGSRSVPPERTKVRGSGG